MAVSAQQKASSNVGKSPSKQSVSETTRKRLNLPEGIRISPSGIPQRNPSSPSTANDLHSRGNVSSRKKAGTEQQVRQISPTSNKPGQNQITQKKTLVSSTEIESNNPQQNTPVSQQPEGTLSSEGIPHGETIGATPQQEIPRERATANDSQFEEAERERLQEEQNQLQAEPEPNDTPENIRTKKKSSQKVTIFPFFPALVLAAFKDILDFALIGSFPGIGTLITDCDYLLIALLIFAFPKQKYKTSGNAALNTKEAFILIGGASIESLFFLVNFLPITIASVGAIYMLEKKEVERGNGKPEKSASASE